MRQRLVRSVLALGVALGLACNGDESGGPTPAAISLSASQAAAIVGTAQQLSTIHPELSWLADSVDLVIKAGAQAWRIAVDVDGESRTYYGVALQRAIATTSAFSTFHLLAFNDASSPTDFLVANGYSSSGNSTPPMSVVGTFGSTAVFAHFIHVSGSAITDWLATQGSANFTRWNTGGPRCDVVHSPSVACAYTSPSSRRSWVSTSRERPCVAERDASSSSPSIRGRSRRIGSSRASRPSTRWRTCTSRSRRSKK